MRIDPIQEAEKFEAQEIKPVRGIFADTSYSGRTKQCCLVGRMAMDVLTFEAVCVYEKYDAVFDLAESIGISGAYAMGLMDGWEDGTYYSAIRPQSSPIRQEQDYLDGVKDGAAAWAECVERQLVDEVRTDEL